AGALRPGAFALPPSAVVAEPPARPAPTWAAIAIAPPAFDAAKGYLRLDVRTAKEFAAGHLPGAARLDLGELARRCPENDPAEVACLRLALGALGIGGGLALAVSGAAPALSARAAPAPRARAR